MDGSNLPRHIVERFERRWAQKLKAQAPASEKPGGGPLDRVRPVGHSHAAQSHEGDGGLRTWPGPVSYPINASPNQSLPNGRPRELLTAL